MTETAPRVITIPAKPELAGNGAVRRQLRVAAYCRVSTDDEEQLTSYEAQQSYYTDKIMTNSEWTMAGIFADRGLTGTSAKKRPEFLRMIRQCRQKKIDMILTKSISRFARNTVDCLNYIRALRELGIAIIFEEQNINTLDSDSEMLITLLGAFAQAESETISENVKWGKRQAMREGKAIFPYRHMYAYERGEDGRPKIIPEQAGVIRRIYDEFLTGASQQMIADGLTRDGIPPLKGHEEWRAQTVRSILSNEKYCGDVLLQKTYVKDCISHKVLRNHGQLPMYLIENHHEGIVSRDTFNAVQAELARRNAKRAPGMKSAPTGRSCYSAKYALTERLVCGECGTLYRRCVWTHHGQKRAVWRCVSRLEYGTRYCKSSPTIDEGPLQSAILAALNTAMRRKSELIADVTDAMRMELSPSPEQRSVGDIERLIEAQEEAFQTLFDQMTGNQDLAGHADEFKRITDTLSELKAEKGRLLEQQSRNAAAAYRVREAAAVMEQVPAGITEWDESLIRQLIDTVRVMSADRIKVYLHGGIEIEQDMIK